MTFEQLEKIGIGLFGQSWKSQLADALNVDRRNIQNWEKQGVARWVYADLKILVTRRHSEILDTVEFYNGIENKP
jgi:hypothetical protein